MTRQGTSQIVHESEVQRQHIRLPIPAQIGIQNNVYMLKDLSAGGFCARGIRGTFPEGRLLPIVLKLSFPQFTMDIALDSQIQHYDAAAQTLGCRFINVAPEQISTINHVLTSFIAGDIVGSSDMLAIASRDNFTKARLPARKVEQAATATQLRRQIPGMVLIMALGLAAISFIAFNIYDRLFTLKSQDAVVVSEGINLHTPMGGTIRYAISSDTIIVTEEEKLATIDTGGLLPAETLVSPCNCYVAERYAQSGEYVESEKPALRLIPISSRPQIEARLPYDDGSRIRMDQKARIKIFGIADYYDGRVTNLKSEKTDFISVVSVTVTPEKRVPIDLAGRPASVVFYTR